LRKEIQDNAAASQWAELNTGIDQWKQKYLYPFGAIAPIGDDEKNSTEKLYGGYVSD
jgi:hypothetical protein